MNASFGIGSVIATGFRTWIKNILAFTLITALVHAPVVIWGVLAANSYAGGDGWQHVRIFLTFSPLPILVLNLIVAGALTYGVVMELQGQRASLGAGIATGFRRFLPALGTGILLVLCMAGLAAVVGLPLALVSRDLAMLGGAIAAVWVLSMLYVAIPASVIERPGIMGALSRSRFLTKGHRFALFALYLFLQIINYGLERAYLAIAAHDAQLYVYLEIAGELLFGALGAVMTAVAYYYLRAEREGTSAAELAAVFD
jgi:hypothetical protein